MGPSVLHKPFQEELVSLFLDRIYPLHLEESKIGQLSCQYMVHQGKQQHASYSVFTNMLVEQGLLSLEADFKHLQPASLCFQCNTQTCSEFFHSLLPLAC